MKINNENYVDLAEKAIKNLSMEKDRYGKPIIITTSQIRNLLSMTANIYNEVMQSRQEKLNDDLRGKVLYLKVRCLYDAGRDESGAFKVFVKNSSLLEIIPELYTRNEYILFNHYMEALVAWHQYFYGKGGRGR